MPAPNGIWDLVNENTSAILIALGIPSASFKMRSQIIACA
jgi:hypothetical protein